MSAQWNHSAQSLENAKLNLSDLCHETLSVIYAEIRAYESPQNNSFSKNIYPEQDGSRFDTEVFSEELKDARDKSSSRLVEFIWRFMQARQECDIGGFNAYCCPYHCHSVSFERRENV